MLRNVSDELARAVADGLGIPMPKAMPRAMEPRRPEVTKSPALSLTHRPGDGSIAGRKVAILVAKGVDAASIARVLGALSKAGAVPRLLAARLGEIDAGKGDALEPDGTLETMPSVVFDAVVVPDGAAMADQLVALGHAREFLRDQYRHGKPMLAMGTGERVLREAGVPTSDKADWAITRDVNAFIEAIGKHRNWDRPTDPPRV
jgi:catalase